MPVYKIKIHDSAFNDIQKATDWYNEQLPDLGARFQNQVIRQINKLKNTSQLYAIRYDNMRCVVIKKFPFMIHFDINDELNTINIYAVFHTSRDPIIWNKGK